MRIFKLFCVCTLSFLLLGCSKNEISLSKDDALEVALDNTGLDEKDLLDVQIKEGNESYEIELVCEDGSYFLRIGKNGSLNGRSFKKVEKTEEEMVENVEEESTMNKATKDTIRDREVVIDASVTDAQANNAYNAALERLGLNDKQVLKVNVKEENGKIVVRIQLTNGDGNTYKAVVTKDDYQVVEWSQE
ncbi:MAG: hypothetical protein Q4C49_05615 [Bacillota bacterium]|nr:hypothetical protein [Bacillota bacterium]